VERETAFTITGDFFRDVLQMARLR